jgi:DNA-binding Lrp family transcriptional regulator
MRKITFIFVLGLLSLSLSCFSQIHVNSTGELTLNSNSWPGGLKVSKITYGNYSIPALYPHSANAGGLGSADKYFHIGYVHHLFSAMYDSWPSDVRVKENITGIDNALTKIESLNPVKFDIKDSFYSTLTDVAKDEYIKTSKNRLGFIAQEVQEILPELVHAEPTTGYLGISTIDMVPVLVEAIKEQQDIIDDLVTRIETMEENCCNNTLKSASLTTGTDTRLAGNEAILYQNTPNPFREQTEIKCFLPEGTVSSTLYIFNMQGIQLEEYRINGTGDQLVRINGNRFKPGMYLYSLVVNGREVDTKRMILTK